MKHTATQACAANQERKKIMSKRSRGQVALDKIRAKSEASKSVADTMSPHKTANSEVKSPLKKLMESPAVGKLADKSSLKLSPTRFDETVSALISKFKSISNVLLSLQSRRKMSTWETVVESYQTISSDALTLDDLLIILSIWNEAFSTRWQPRTFDAKQNARTFELIVEIPASSTPSDTITIEDNAPGSSSNQPAASVESTSLLRALRITTFA